MYSPRIILLSLFFLSLGCFVASAGDYYVDVNTGSDANSGLSPDDAWQTVCHAIDITNPTEADPAVIHLAAGNYANSQIYPPQGFEPTFPLCPKSHTTILGEDMYHTSLESGGYWDILSFEGVTDVVIKNLTLQGEISEYYVSDELKGLNVNIIGSQVGFENIMTNGIGGGSLVANRNCGISVRAGSILSLRDCLFEQMNPRGIRADASVVEFDFCSLAGGLADYVTTLLSAGGAIFKFSDSIVTGRFDTAQVQMRYSLCNLPIEGDGNLTGFPGWVSGPAVDPSNGYYLPDDSPCIDAGSMSAEEAGFIAYSTRPDLSPDTGQADIGFHHYNDPQIEIVASPGTSGGAPFDAVFSLDQIGGNPPFQYEWRIDDSDVLGTDETFSRTFESNGSFVMKATMSDSLGRQASDDLIITVGSDYYVNVATGSDADSGAAPDAPWKTLTHALTGVEGTPDMQCVIHVAPGTYSPETGEAFPLRIRSYVSLLGENRDTTIVNAQQTAGCIWTAASYPDRALDVTIEGLSVTGGAAPDPQNDWGGGIACGADNAVIRNNKIFSNQNGEAFGGGIYVSAENVLIEGNEIFDNYDDDLCSEGSGLDGAICVYSCSCLVRNNYIHDNECAAIKAIDEGPDPTIILQNNVFEKNVCPWYDDQDCSLSGRFEIVEDCVITGCCGFYAPPGKSLLLYNCLFAGDESVSCHSSSWSGVSGSFDLDFCTFVSGASPQVAVLEADGRFENCVFYGSAVPISTIDDTGYHEPGTAEVHYCRIPDSAWASLPTNFDADPLFVTGPLGDYYLSQTAAGQAQDSPCTDAGSITAEEAWLDEMTTRTDGAPDAGVVDIGYHYLTLLMLPEVWVSTPSDTYSHGDMLQMVFEAINPNPFSYAVDLYAAVITPDGTIWTIDAGWNWSASLNPWFASLELPPNFPFDPTTLLTIVLPSAAPPISDPGTYWVAAAFAHVGTTTFIGQPSLSALELAAED